MLIPPVRPGYVGTIKKGLIDKATVKITEIWSCFETTSEGTIEWDTTAFGKYKVASGVYMILYRLKMVLRLRFKVMIIR
jgi:hypothetical protein